MTEQGARNLATAFIKQWMKDGCPPTDEEFLDVMLQYVSEDLRKECRSRQAQWANASSSLSPR